MIRLLPLLPLTLPLTLLYTVHSGLELLLLLMIMMMMETDGCGKWTTLDGFFLIAKGRRSEPAATLASSIVICPEQLGYRQ